METVRDFTFWGSKITADGDCSHEIKRRLLLGRKIMSNLDSILECKEIKLANPKENQSWMFIGRTGAEAETPIFWPPGVKSWLIGKDSDARKDWRQEEKGTTEDEMVGWHHWLNGHEFEQNLGMVKDREAWRAAVHEVAKSWTWLRDWTTNRYLDR